MFFNPAFRHLIILLRPNPDRLRQNRKISQISKIIKIQNIGNWILEIENWINKDLYRFIKRLIPWPRPDF